MLRPVHALLILFGVVLLSAPAAADINWLRPELRVSTGAHFLTGDYGQEEDTDIWYVPLSVKLDWDSFLVQLTVPYIRITGPGNVVGGVDAPVVVGQFDFETETNDGLGDIVLAGTYVFWELPDWLPLFELTAKVKFPTADEDKGLGTGEYDFGFQVDASKTFGRVTPFASFGYRVLGDLRVVALDNTFFASFGVGYEVTESVSGGLIYDWRQSSTSSISDGHELSPYMLWKLGRFRVQPYGVVGFTEGAADWGGGLQLSVIY